MKDLILDRILVPTDFSDCANHALDAAIKMAQKLKATLHLYHKIKLPDNWNNLSVQEKEAFPEVLKKIRKAEKRFQQILADHSEVKITWSLSGEKLVEGIRNCIETREIDLVVMGSHGKSGVSEIFVGSNTQKVVRLIHRPVLVIKSKVESIDFKEVVFSSNFNLNEKDPFLYFKSLILPFEPRIHLLTIHTSHFFDVPTKVTKSVMEDFKLLCHPLECETHIFKTGSIEGGIRKFAKQVNADLIAISNFNRRPIKRMLMGSNVEALVNHSNLPILSIDFPESSD